MNQEKDPQTAQPEETKPEAEKINPEQKPEEQTTGAQQPEANAAKDAGEAAEKTEQKAAKKKKEGPSFFQSEKFKHGSTATAFTAIFIVVIVLLNVFVGILSDKYPSINLDVTKSGGNSLSGEALKVIDSVKTEVDITICATKEACEQNDVTGSGSSTDYAQVSRLFSKAAERNSNIKLSYVDLVKNPTFAADYKSDNLAEGDVVVKSSKRYRVLSSSDLFKTTYSSDYSSTKTTSNVDSALASALNTVTAETMPVAAFDTAHNEGLDGTGYKHLLSNSSFETKDFNLLTDKIPEKTQLLVLGCPESDLTSEEIDKVDAFLNDKSSDLDRSLLVTCAPGQASLKNLGSYLEEWGLAADTNAAVEETSQSNYYSSPLYIFTDVQSGLDLGGKSSYSYTNFLMPNTCPITVKGSSVGNKKTYELMKSSDTSVVLKTSGNTSSTSDPAAQTVAALSQMTVSASGSKTVHANVILSGSSSMFSSQLLTTTVFSNGSYLGDLSRYATGTTDSSSTISTTSNELYAKDITITSQKTILLLGYGVFTLLIPLIVMIAGIIVHRKRRAL
jgi:ABC-2 type transport system permease protein